MLKNFGWAPQRFTSRKRPFGRISIRLRATLKAVGDEARGSDPTRTANARYLLKSLGGQRSYRLLLGGMLADLSHEHYIWVAGGDKNITDPLASSGRVDMFLQRLGVLYDEGLLLTDALAESFTGQAIDFLKKASYLRHGRYVAVFGFGGFSEQDVREMEALALNRMRRIVHVVRLLCGAYRPKNAWVHELRAFRLPSPLSMGEGPADAGDGDMARHRAECEQSLSRIFGEGRLPPEATIKELKRLLPFAEAHARHGASTRQAWARASADFPEFALARQGVELLLIARPSTSNVERKFRSVPVQERRDRLQLLDTTLETLLIGDQAPLPDQLARTSGGELTPIGSYLPEAMKLYERTFGKSFASKQVTKRRRDAGVPRGAGLEEKRPRPDGPQTEASFIRAREAAIARVVRAGASERERIASRSSLTGAPIPSAPVEETIGFRGACDQLLGRAAAEENRQLSHSTLAAAARKNLRANLDKAATSEPAAQWADRARPAAAPLKAGVVLVSPRAQKCVELARAKHFRVCHDPAQFLESAMRERARAPGKGHVVIVALAERSDFAFASRLACGLVGAFRTDAKSSSEGRGRQRAGRGPLGALYVCKVRGPGPAATLAISELARDVFPLVRAVLESAAALASSRVKFSSAEAAAKHYIEEKRKRGQQSRPWTSVRVLVTEAEFATISKGCAQKYKGLYNHPEDFIDFLSAATSGDCPGNWANLDV